MIKKGDKVKTIYGNIETVMAVEPVRIITYESFSKQTWHHPTKVFNLDGSSILPFTPPA